MFVLADAAATAAATATTTTSYLLRDSWIIREMFKPDSMALTVFAICLCAVTGLALGSIKIGGAFKLGIPGTMFTGILISRLLSIYVGKDAMNDYMLQFTRDFGLILFVYGVGVQVGPGFLASLRRNGLVLNIFAACTVLTGAAIAVSFAYWANTDIRAAAGLFAGASTNAPSLGSAGEALKSLFGAKGAVDAANITSPAMAVAYPFGLLGVILVMVLLRIIFRVNPEQEALLIEKANLGNDEKLATMNVEITNVNLDGLAIAKIPAFKESDVVISRIHHAGNVEIAHDDSILHIGDVVLAVGTQSDLKKVQLIIGKETTTDLRAVATELLSRDVLVTHKNVLGKEVSELNLARRLGVAVTRISRTGVEFTAVGHMELQFGDRVRLVGPKDALQEAAKELGDSVKELNHPRLIPIFLGILIGVFLGSIPIYIPGVPGAVKLGLAAGPMIVAIILARMGRIGPMIWYMPHSASQLLRELGIVMFLIGVGLRAGDGFFNVLASPVGLQWLGLGALITFIPLMLAGLFARIFFKLNYLTVCGMLCGSMNSPSLAFTNTMTPSEAPSVSFATVYPLTMVLRVMSAQLIVLIFCR